MGVSSFVFPQRYSNGLGANMDEEVMVELVGGPFDGDRWLCTVADLRRGNGELRTFCSWWRYTQRYVFARRGPDGLEYRYAREPE